MPKNKLSDATKELAFQMEEKQKQALELIIANKELVFQNEEKGKVESPLLENESSFYNAGANLSEQKKVENVLKESEEKFKLIFEKSLAPIIVADDKGNYLEVNKAAAEIFEYSINELIGMNVGDLITTSNPNAAKLYEEYIKKGEEIGEFGFISKKGTPKIVQYQAVRIKPDFNLSILMDVTEQKQTSQYARSLIEASLDPLVTISANGKILDINAASIKVTGVEREKLIGTDFSSYFTEPQKAQEGYLQVFEKGFVADYPLTIKHKNGKLTDVLYNASVYKDDKGNVLGVFAAARDVTDTKEAETLLRKNTQTLAIGCAAAGLAIIEINYTTNLAHLTDEAAKMYFGPEAKAQSVSRQTLHETFHPDNLETLKNLIEKSLDPNGTGFLHIDHRVIWPNGEVRWLRVSKHVFFNRLGLTAKPEYSILAAQDVTNIKEAQEKLQAGEERIRLATKASGVGVWEWNVITNKVRWDAQMFRIYGLEPTADGLIEYSTWSNSLVTEDRADQERILQDTVKKLGSSKRSFKIIRASDGMPRDIEAIETVRANAEGNAEWVLGTNLDVTEPAMAKKKIEESEKKYRTLLTSIDQGFALCEIVRNKEGKAIDFFMLEVNPTYEEQTGVSKETVLGKRIIQTFPSLIQLMETYAAVVDNQCPVVTEDYFEDTDRWFENKAYPFGKEQFTVLFRDITSQKRASQYARSLIEASLDPLVTINVDGKITDVNEASIKVTGVEREKLINTDFTNYFTEPQKAREGYQQVFEKGFVSDYPLTIKHKNGKLTDVLYNASVYKDDKGNVLGVFAAARDVTEQKWAIDLRIANKELVFQNEEKEKRAEELVILVKELESLNYISSHDLQEPLRQIQIFSSRISDGDLKRLSDAGKTYFEKINNAAKRMQNLINDLLAYSRSKTEARKFKLINLNQIVNEVKEDFEEIILDKHATFEVAELGAANVIIFQFRQLIYNLIGNALKFSKPNTPPHIIIKSENVKSNQFLVAGDTTETEYCHISITDNGIGFEPQYKDRIFEVFQRLHDKQKIAGTGIGLAIVKNIVKNHNGFMTATGEPNKGATFDIYIPTNQKL